jgi:hypothetical protein
MKTGFDFHRGAPEKKSLSIVNAGNPDQAEAQEINKSYQVSGSKDPPTRQLAVKRR